MKVEEPICRPLSFNLMKYDPEIFFQTMETYSTRLHLPLPRSEDLILRWSKGTLRPVGGGRGVDFVLTLSLLDR